MRTSNATIDAAIDDAVSLKAKARLTAYKSRTFFEVADLEGYVTSISPAVGDTGPALPATITLSTTARKVITAVINPDTSKINFMVDDNPALLIPLSGGNPIAADPYSRPGIFGNKLFFFSPTTGWTVATMDTDAIVARSTSCLSGITTLDIGSIPTGAIYPVSETQKIILFIDDGAIRIAYIDASNDIHLSPGRIFDPAAALSETATDLYKLHYAGAALVDDKIFAYFTRYDGAVQGIYYKFALGGETIGSWSDFFIALPEDLSNFDIGNVFVNNDRIFMVGRFYRQDQFAADGLYTLITYSDDGKTFTLDRRVLVSLIDLRFLAVYDSANLNIIYSADNRTYTDSAPYQIAGEDAPHTEVAILQISGSASSGWQAALAAGKEEYFTDTNVAEGCYAKLEIGIFTSINDYEWIKYHDCIISGVEKTFEDGVRSMGISIVPDGLWHTSAMTHPYYMEFQGKQYVQSPMTALDTLYNMTANAGQTWALAQDFWLKSEPDGYTRQTHAGSTTTDNWAEDLVESGLLTEYPVFGDDTNYTLNIFGWSRAGIPSVNPNVPDSTPTNTPNDDFYAMITVENLVGEQSEIVATAGQLTSTYKNPPQTYFPAGVRAGSLPVTYSIPNPGEGWKIIKLGVRVISGSGNTTYYLERVEMPGILGEFALTSNYGYLTSLDDPANVQVTNTQKGVPQILFAVTPYSAWNFDLRGRFKMVGPYTYAGLLGLATDKKNYFVGYMRVGYLGIAQVRNRERVVIAELAVPEIVEDTTYDIRFWHKDGEFGIEYKESTSPTWAPQGSQLTYSYDASTDGPIVVIPTITTDNVLGLSTDSTGGYIYHVGIWTIIDPPKFRSCGFRSGGNTIPLMPCDQSGSDILASTFPASGTVSCDEHTYTYSGKNTFFAANTLRGPFQLRAILDWNSHRRDREDAFYFSGIRAIECYNFAWLASVANHDLYNGAIVAVNNGYSWIAAETFFKPWITTDGQVVVELERMRIYALNDDIPEAANQSLANKVYLTNGLTGVAQVAYTNIEVFHDEGAFVYIHNDDSVSIYGFAGVSGEEDYTIEGLLDKVCRISGTKAVFPGDTTSASSPIGDGATIVL